MKRKKVVAYGRVSVSNGNGDSLEAQLEQIADWAELGGYRVVAEYVDDGVSGAKEMSDRDGLAAAIATIIEGEAEILAVHRADRLARALHVQEAILARVWQVGGRVFEVVGGEILEDDPEDPYRTFIRQVMGAAAQLERGLVRARMQGGRKRRRAAGYHIGGSRPFGFAVDEDGKLTPNLEEQKTIGRMRALRAEGRTLRAIGAEVGLHPEHVRRVLSRSR
jgi:DNA invertase Pin-like site-specific DNA recombinase